MEVRGVRVAGRCRSNDIVLLVRIRSGGVVENLRDDRWGLLGHRFRCELQIPRQLRILKTLRCLCRCLLAGLCGGSAHRERGGVRARYGCVVVLRCVLARGRLLRGCCVGDSLGGLGILDVGTAVGLRLRLWRDIARALFRREVCITSHGVAALVGGAGSHVGCV